MSKIRKCKNKKLFFVKLNLKNNKNGQFGVKKNFKYIKYFSKI